MDGRRCPVELLISTHALREEGDAFKRLAAIADFIFLPTPSARRATGHLLPGNCLILFLPTPSARRATSKHSIGGQHHEISTHALREEGDLICPPFPCSVQPHFYPRPPRGGRLTRNGPTFLLFRFLPTPSARRATVQVEQAVDDIEISTHALREEGDLSLVSSHGSASHISTHALREEGDSR